MRYLRGKATKLLAYVLCAVLVVPTLAGAAPMQVRAEQEQTQESEVSVENDAISVEGNNSVGNLLATELLAEQANDEQATSEAYYVLDVDVLGNVATVEYSALKDCNIIVGLYDEFTDQMLASGVAEVSSEEEFVDVTIIAETMPTYFVVKVYLVNRGNMKPLSEEYYSSLYTQDMQELLNSTVDDYDADRVLNLDEDKTNNFMVYSEDTILVATDENTNVVTKPDENGNEYKITNIDANISSLKVGDIVAIGSDENVVIIKVNSISIDGTTATIVEDKVELEEVFEVVKIQAVGDAEDAVVDESTCPDDIVYVGEVSPEVLTGDDEDDDGSKVFADGEVVVDFSNGVHVEGNFKGGKKFEFPDEKDEEKCEGNKTEIEAGINAKGDMTLALGVNIDFLVTKRKRYVEFYIDLSVSGNIGVAGNFEAIKTFRKEIETPVISIPINALLEASINPKLIFEFEAEASVGYSASGRIGFRYNSVAVKKWTKIKAFDLNFFNVSVEGTLSFGVGLETTLGVIDEAIANVGISAECLLETNMKAETSLGVSTEEGEEHLCGLQCFSGSKKLIYTLEPTLELVNHPIEIEAEYSREIPLKDWYISIKYKEFGSGECPYKIGGTKESTLFVKDSQNNPISGATILIYGKSDTGEEISTTFTTDWEGLATMALPCGDYQMEVSKQTYKTTSRHLTDYGSFQYMDDITLRSYEAIIVEPINLGNGVGIVGENGYSPYKDKYIDVLYIGDDDFTITGTGYDTYVFRNSEINMVVLEHGVTTIPQYFFGFCKINNIVIPSTVTTIGEEAFRNTILPEDFRIGEGVKNIGNNAYLGINVTIPRVEITEELLLRGYAFNGVTIDEVVLKNTENVFFNSPFFRATINEVIINEDVSSIPHHLFEGCTIEKIELPEHITEIGANAFANATLPANFKLIDGIKVIRPHAFEFSNLILPNVKIEDGMTLMESAFRGLSIGEVVLNSDKNITIDEPFTGTIIEEVTFGENVNSVPESLFAGSTIEEIELPEYITEIGAHAFAGATLPERFQLPERIEIVRYAAFNDIDTSLLQLKIVEGMTLESSAFANATIGEVILESDKNLRISSSPFGRTMIKEVAIGENVNSIPSHLFAGSTIEKIELPEHITEIGVQAFAGATLPERFQLSDGITSIYYGAFQKMKVTLPMVKIKEGMILESRAFEEVTIKEVVLESDENLTIQTPFYGAELNKVVIDKNVSSIPSTLFSMSTINAITIPANVTTIESSAFAYATLPDTFSVSASVDVASDAFNGSTYTYPYETVEAVGVVAILPEEIRTEDVLAEEDEAGVSSEMAEKVEENETESVKVPEPITPTVPTLPARTETYTGLRPNDTYNFYVVKAYADFMNVEDILNSNNILYVGQMTSDANGNASITYIPCADDTYAEKFITCKSRYDISAATITQENLTYTGEEQEVVPAVLYGEQALNLFEDFNLGGDYKVTEPGKYSVTVVGTNDYCGKVAVTFSVIDENAVLVSGIVLDNSTLELKVQEEATLTATVTPEDASNKTVTWTSSNESVATVDATGKVTAMAAGSAIITATAVDGSEVSQSCAVTVIQPVTEISLSEPSLTLKTGGTATLIATVLPDNASDKTVTWTSSDESVATVDANGKVTAMAAGSAIITAAAQDGSGILASCEVTVTVPIVFEDVEAGAYYEIPVQWAVEKGITNGYGSNTTFCPELVCTRGQIVTFLWRAKGCPEPASLDNPFTDVAADAYYYKAVLWAVEQGITNGYGSDTIFNPDGECTRGQVATFMWRAEGKPANSGSNPFVDLTDDAFYYDAVLWAVEKGVTNGYGSADTFCPDLACTRGQIVTFLYRGMK